MPPYVVCTSLLRSNNCQHVKCKILRPIKSVCINPGVSVSVLFFFHTANADKKFNVVLQFQYIPVESMLEPEGLAGQLSILEPLQGAVDKKKTWDNPVI